ncbi:TPM domain-containing protein [Peribacillus frigoritolerans]|nr:TPM domain-containing protein [Peribacillus frigoritolerans]
MIRKKSELIELGKRLDDATKAQISVLTVDSMEGSEIEEYSVEAFRSFKLGDAELNNGVLIVLAMEEQKIRIEVGYGLEGAITDIKSGQILDDVAIPALKEGKYDVALTETYKAVYNDVTKEYNLGDEFYQDLSVQPESETFQPSGLQIFLIIIVVIIVFILDAKFFKGFFPSNANQYPFDIHQSRRRRPWRRQRRSTGRRRRKFRWRRCQQGLVKTGGSDRETGLFFMYGPCVGPTMENLSAHLFSVVKR